MQLDEKELFRFAVESGLVSRQAFAEARGVAAAKGVSLADALVMSGVLTHDELRRVVAQAHGVPFVTLATARLDPEALMLIPEPVSRERQVVAIGREGSDVEVALLDLKNLKYVSLPTGMHARPRLTDSASMRSALLYYQQHQKKLFGGEIAQYAQGVVAPTSEAGGDLLAAAQTLPVSQLVDVLLRHAHSSHAQDVHLTRTLRGLRVAYRIGGVIHEAMVLPAASAASIILRLKLLAQVPLTTVVPREGRFVLTTNGSRTTVMLSSTQTTGGERIVLHLVPEHTGRDGFSLEGLGCMGPGLEALHTLLGVRSGLIVVAGEEGSGKTSFLYALADVLSTPGRHVVVVEEDIECALSAATQVKTNPEYGISLSHALRAALRQDPDVVVVSSLADPETARVAAQAANRGVLVVVAQEAASLTDALYIINETVGAELFTAVWQGGVGLGLARRLCVEHTQRSPTREDTSQLEKSADPVRVLSILKDDGVVDVRSQWKDLRFGAPLACEKCDAGYAGRVGLQQVMLATHTLRAVLEHADDAKKSKNEITRIARAEGMLTLAEDALYKAVQNITSIDEALRLAREV